MPTREDYERAIGRAQRAGDQPAVQDLIQRASADMMQGQGGIVANLGAGFDTAIQGVKQLVGQGPSDEQLREKRRLDEQLAEGTTGGSLAQFVGEMAPSLMIPGGSGAKVLQRALAAARGPGFMAVPTAAQAAGRLSMPMAAGGAALESGAASALMPTMSDESKLGNVALGTGFGAGVPVLGKTMSALRRGAGELLERNVGAALPGQMGANAARRVAERDAQAGLTTAGVDMTPSRYAVQDYQPNTTAVGPRGQQLGEFEPTTAAAYHASAPRLAEVEKAVRGYDASQWATRDAREAEKRWTHLDESLRGERDIEASRGRARALDPPYQSVSPRLWDTNMARLTRTLESAVDSPEYIGNPTVRSAIDMLRKQIDSNTITPQTLHELRKTLASGMKGTPGLSDMAVSAARTDPALLRLVGYIDNVMENSMYARRRGDWGDWRAAYGAEKRVGEGAKAESRLRQEFTTEGGVPKRGTSDVPVLGAGFAGQAEKFAVPKTGQQAGQNVFDPRARQAVADIVRDLHANGIVDRVRKAATLGGSDTAYNMTNAAVMGLVGDMMMGTMGMAAGGALVKARAQGNILQAKRDILTRIMQDPAQFRQFIDAAAQRAQQMAAREGASPTARFGSAALAGTQLATEPDTR